MKTKTNRREFHSRKMLRSTTATIHMEQAEQLRRFSDAASISVSQLIRQIIGAWLAQQAASGSFGLIGERDTAVALRRRNG